MDETGPLTFQTDDVEATLAAGRTLAPMLEPGDVVALCGDLGAGKTAFVRGVAEGLGFDDPVTSPTFNMLVVHEGPLDLNHFDLYRLERASELDDIDFWGVMEAGGASFVEWGNRFPESLPAAYLEIAIVLLDEDTREFRVRPVGERPERLASSWVARLEEGGSS